MRIISAASLTTPPFLSSGAAGFKKNKNQKLEERDWSSALSVILTPADRDALISCLTEMLLFHIWTCTHLIPLSAQFQLHAAPTQNYSLGFFFLPSLLQLAASWFHLSPCLRWVFFVFFCFCALFGDELRNVTYYIYLARVATGVGGGGEA